jgi:hypothetical protein
VAAASTGALDDRERLIRQVLWWSLAAGTIVSAIVCYRVWTKAFVLGSVEGRWVHEYLADFPRYSVRALVQTLLVGAALAAIPLGLVRRFAWAAFAVWVAAAFFVQFELRSQTRYSLEQMFVSDGANGYYGPAQKYPAAAFLSYPEKIRADLPAHSRTNMPGKQLLTIALTKLMTDPEWMAWATVAASNLGALLIFLFVRELLTDWAAAVLAAAFYLIVPSKLYFFPVMNTVSPTLILLFAYLWLRWAHSGRLSYALAMGAAFYLLVFFEPLPMVMGLFFLIMMLWLRWPAGMRLAGFLKHAAAAAAVAVAIDAALFAMFRFELIATFLWQMNDAVDFNQRASRPYGIWVVRDLIDFAFGTGFVQAGALLGVVALALLSPRREQPITAAAVGLCAVILVTDLLGVNRGEVVRLWIFLGCFAQIPAAYACARLDSRAAVALVVLTSLVQGALGTTMMGFATP